MSDHDEQRRPVTRRRETWLAIATGAVLVGGVLAVIFGPSTTTHPTRVEAVQITRPAPTTSAAPLPATAPTTSGAPTSTTGPKTAATTTATHASTTSTSAARSCRMSHDPACGAFYFDPAPLPDQPVRISVTVSPSHPAVGQTVTFHVVMDDADGAIGCIGLVDDGYTAHSNECGLPPVCDRFGAWPPPPPAPGHLAQDFTETYKRPGQYTFQIRVGPYNAACVDARTGRGEQPYVSAGSSSTIFTVN